jgi:hypothetical protein
MIYKIPTYCAFTTFADGLLSILSTLHLDIGQLVYFLYTKQLHLGPKGPLYHMTSRLGRDLVGFFLQCGLALDVCLALRRMKPNWLLYIFIFLLQDFVDRKN